VLGALAVCIIARLQLLFLLLLLLLLVCTCCIALLLHIMLICLFDGPRASFLLLLARPLLL
jgi:hypothetical protein